MFKLKNVRVKDILYIQELTIKKGEITCIVGKSGGGKTTFLKLLNNMISYDRGTIKFKDKEITEIDPVSLRKKVPMLPQNPAIFSGTIKENFTMTLQYAGKDVNEESNQAFINIMKTVGMEKYSISDNVEKLSGGEKQRIALARIILLDPDILLLDEPSSALDEETEELIIKMVVDNMKEKKGTLVMVTHSTKIAKQYGEKIVTINNGQIDQIT